MLRFWTRLLLSPDGAGGTGGGEGAAAAGETGQAAAAAGAEEGQVAAAEDRAQQFAKFKADYKAEYDAEVQGIIQRRMKAAKRNEQAAQEYREKTSGILDTLAIKYGIDADDVDAIAEAVANDDIYLEDRAMEAGMEPDAFRRFHQTERENERFREQEQRQQKMQQWFQEEAQLKEIYPGFDFGAEMDGDPQFQSLVLKGIPMKDAFELCHKDEIFAGAMQYASAESEKRLARASAKNGARPDEGALNRAAPVQAHFDFDKMTGKDIDDYLRRARSGQIIDFKSRF